MKLHGQEINALQEREIVFSRPNGDITFKVRGVVTFEDYTGKFPKPEPPTRSYPDGREESDHEDLAYVKDLGAWVHGQTAWLIVESLKVTEGLEWDTVDVNDYHTYGNYESELLASGFTMMDINRIVNEVNIVNGFSQEMVEGARKSFLPTAGQ